MNTYYVLGFLFAARNVALNNKVFALKDPLSGRRKAENYI